jgi:hypothetical protein
MQQHGFDVCFHATTASHDKLMAIRFDQPSHLCWCPALQIVSRPFCTDAPHSETFRTRFETKRNKTKNFPCYPVSKQLNVPLGCYTPRMVSNQ